MPLRCGIVGLPNVGKSTLFNALTAAAVPAENYPFCTVDPNTGVVTVPDPRLQALDAFVHAARIVPTTVELVDIAGLVAGASQGEGLGNQFLAHIRETHAIAHVVRCFADGNVTHVSGGLDPLRDIETIETELALADLDTVQRRLDRVQRSARAGDKEARAEQPLLEAILARLSDGRAARGLEQPAGLQLLTAKPVLYVANIDEASLADGNALSAAVEARAQAEGAGCVRLCAKIEAELAQLEPEERAHFLEELGLKEPGLDRLVRAVHRLLGLVAFFTVGPKETRAWTTRHGATAPEAAGEIHSDFERSFIRAEVIGYDDFIACRGEAGARAAGRLRIEGRDYVVQDGDVMHFRVGA
jgi:hypothetical protein